MPQKIILFIGAIVVIVAALIGVVYFVNKDAPAVGGAPLQNDKGYTIQEVAIDEMPDYRRPVQYGDGVPAEARAIIETRVALAIAALDKDKTNPTAWYELGVLYKTANDLAGAEVIWEFLTRAAPNDATAFDNLGKMYHFDLRDFAKAEEYLKKSLAINPDATTPYFELFDLYTLTLKNHTAAVDIMEKAAVHFPENSDFPYALGVYQRSRGNTVAARAYLEQAADLARAAGNLSLVSAINAELAALP